MTNSPGAITSCVNQFSLKLHNDYGFHRNTLNLIWTIYKRDTVQFMT